MVLQVRILQVWQALEGSEPLMEPDPAGALWAGSLDRMVDQVTRSIVSVHKRYPYNEWVSRQGVSCPAVLEKGGKGACIQPL